MDMVMIYKCPITWAYRCEAVYLEGLFNVVIASSDTLLDLPFLSSTIRVFKSMKKKQRKTKCQKMKKEKAKKSFKTKRVKLAFLYLLRVWFFFKKNLCGHVSIFMHVCVCVVKGGGGTIHVSTGKMY